MILLLQKVGNLDPIATKVWESGSNCYKRLGARRRFVQLPQSVSSQHTPQRWSEYEITESVEDDTKFLLSLLSPRYDLYDCDLDNAMAAPGSMFAPAYWAETTPTIELELGQLFPEQRYAQSCSLGCVFFIHFFPIHLLSFKYSPKHIRTPLGDDCESPVELRQKNRRENVLSLTSDLTSR